MIYNILKETTKAGTRKFHWAGTTFTGSHAEANAEVVLLHEAYGGSYALQNSSVPVAADNSITGKTPIPVKAEETKAEQDKIDAPRSTSKE